MVSKNVLLKHPKLAEILGSLAKIGDKLFYEGDLANKIAELYSAGGGYLTRDDLSHYQVIRRPLLQLKYRNSRLFTNPPPTSGGALIAMALKLLEQQNVGALGFGIYQHLDLLVAGIAATNQARLDMLLTNSDGVAEYLMEEQ
ncbi:MAG: gamma-glutamyltranspeptidase/glutathione hydrolase [Porticoccus sp.]